MSIKSDKWIRRMAASHGMIDPFEPEWEGYVTLEFSNTTLPARIYANEGVAQVVFFEADEESHNIKTAKASIRARPA